ncbi:sialic acid-binding Ig-like lectin 15 isoform X2 [Stigmatopora argus]
MNVDSFAPNPPTSNRLDIYRHQYRPISYSSANTKMNGADWLIFSPAAPAGSVCLSELTLNVSTEVKVIRGQEALLGCSFTPPRRADFPGNIRVSWSRHAKGEAFFQCEVNATAPAPSCLGVEGYSLVGDLRRGASSLLIGKALDQGEYFCKVTVGREKAQEKLILRVQAKPSIVNLSSFVVGNQTMLQCIAEGDPLPDITWLSESGRPLDASTAPAGPNQLYSSVPYEGQGELTCLAVSALGRTHRKHGQHRQKGWETAALAAGIAVAVTLLLVAVVVVAYRLRLREKEQSAQFSSPRSHQAAPLSFSLLIPLLRFLKSVKVCPTKDKNKVFCTRR